MSEEAPGWRYLVVGLLCVAFAAYLLWTGEMAIDKRHTMTITRAADPLIYWITVLASGAVGLLALRKTWKLLVFR
jgi:TRAP-type C4-dicarboxylate transport system permease small subunit